MEALTARGQNGERRWWRDRIAPPLQPHHRFWITLTPTSLAQGDMMIDTDIHGSAESNGRDSTRQLGKEIDSAAMSELDHIRREIRAEINLLNSRLNALISSQSFLVIAYGTSLSAGYDDWSGLFTITLPPLFAILGLLLVLEARPGIQAAHEAISHWRGRENQLIGDWPELRPYTLATDEKSRRRMELRQHAGGLFSNRAPVIFTVAWLIFLILPFVLRSWG